METGSTEHPPKPEMVVRVGVTGHRTKALCDAKIDLDQLEKTLTAVLSKIREEAKSIFASNADMYVGKGPTLRLISSLAEGSDRIAAKVAKRLYYELESPIPFAKAVYEGTFTDTQSQANSIKEFAELFKEANKTLTLDGMKDAKTKAYEAVGRAMLRHSDVLISVWDGLPPEPGGTGQITGEALKHNVPTIWIPPGSPGKAYLLNNLLETGEAGEATDFEADISKRLKDALTLPSETEVLALKRFYHEKKAHRRLALIFVIFYAILAWRPKKTKSPNNTFAPKSTRLEDKGSKQPSFPSQKIEFLAFSWADGLANFYADRHRSSFITTYFLGASAVVTAFLGYARYPNLFKLELFIIVMILAIVGINRVYHWHDRWIDYRILAEWFRQMRFLHPFSRITPTLKVPAYLGEDDLGPTWFNWYFRAFVRQAGIPHAEVSLDYVTDCREMLLDSIAYQDKYHHDKAKDLHLIHHRLHTLAVIAFFVTLAACLLHIFCEDAVAAVLGENTDLILTILAIGAPALGSALEGINHQGEFERMSRRSKAIRNRINDLAKQVPLHDKNFRELGRLAEDFCELQILEQTDWRSVFVGKDLDPS